MKKILSKPKRLVGCFFLVSILILTSYILNLKSAAAFQQTSTNFKLEGEFGIFGGAKSSANYKLTDTGGGFAPGISTSGSYEVCSGFQCVLQKVPTITFTLGSNSVNLGSLSAASVTTQSHIFTVNTTLTTGYQVTVVEDGNLRSSIGNDINDVSGGTVDAGSEEYGLATSKSGQNIVQDSSCGPDPDNASAVTGSSQTVASASVDVTGDQTTMCYGASISPTTPAGQYQHTLTYIATGTF